MVERKNAGNAREAALACLGAFRKRDAWSDLTLKETARRRNLSERDAALAYRLCFGVLQNLFLLDYYIGRFSSVKINRIEPLVLDVLRMGVYQLRFMDRIPDSAAVDESVRLVKKNGFQRASGYVNALLRAVARAGAMPEVPKEDFGRYLSVRYSHPLWLVRRILGRLGPGQTEAFLRADNEQTPMCVQVNTLAAGLPSVKEALEACGVTAEPHPFLPDCLLLEDTGNLETLKPFADGLILVQDAASRMAVLAADPKPGFTVIDACSAPGGKAFSCAMLMKDTGCIRAFDIHAHRLALIEQGARRLNIRCIETGIMNASEDQPGLHGSADLVMADVPCSGFGVIRKKPDMRYKDEESVRGLPETQLGILDGLSPCVKPGGRLLYSTCTVLREENERVVESFLMRHPEFSMEPYEIPGAGSVKDGLITLWPQIHGTDGFFIALMRKKDG